MLLKVVVRLVVKLIKVISTYCKYFMLLHCKYFMLLPIISSDMFKRFLKTFIE